MSEEAIKSHLGWAIGSIFLFWPTAIIAIIHSMEVDAALGRGDKISANCESDKAKRWCKISMIIGIPFNLIVIFAILFIIIAGCITMFGVAGKLEELEDMQNKQLAKTLSELQEAGESMKKSITTPARNENKRIDEMVRADGTRELAEFDSNVSEDSPGKTTCVADHIISELIDDELSFRLQMKGATPTEIRQLKTQLLEQLRKVPEAQRVDAARNVIHELIRMHRL